MKKKILVIHGPNLNLIGNRETGIYGKESIDSINNEILHTASSVKLECEIIQSNHEGEIIDALHNARDNFHGCIINAGAFSHYSHAIRDAISAIKLPCVEVHLSNIYAREEFRRHSVISEVCVGSIAGFGKNSYILAVHALSAIL